MRACACVWVQWLSWRGGDIFPHFFSKVNKLRYEALSRKLLYKGFWVEYFTWTPSLLKYNSRASELRKEKAKSNMKGKFICTRDPWSKCPVVSAGKNVYNTLITPTCRIMTLYYNTCHISFKDFFLIV